LSAESIYDVAVLGSGPGGYVAAIKGSQLGLKVALIEQYPKLGGTCLHWGCVPTKALLLNAEMYQQALNGKEFGILYSGINVDFQLVRKRKDKLIKKLSMGIDFLVRKNQIQTFNGKGRLLDRNTLQIEGENPQEITAKNIIIATGSEAKIFPEIPFEGQSIMTNKEILNLESIPKALLIIGGGSVGIEFASIFSRFGTAVTVVEMLPRILPLEDADISQELLKLLTKQGIKFHLNAKLEELKLQDGNIEAIITEGNDEPRKIIAEKALLATGRQPATGGIGLEQLGIENTRGYIPVDKYMQTSIPGIFAIGDVVPTQALAHVASHEGMLAMEYIAHSKGTPINYDLIPSCTYCHPEVASVGLSETKAKERGFEVAVSRFPFAAVSKASILGENEGFIKLVSDRKYGQILGVHMIGPHVTELLSEGTALIGLEGTAADLSHLIHPHPTLSEGIMEAANMLYSGSAIHF
jgi:dihydrolipoamide dehydrogenase